MAERWIIMLNFLLFVVLPIVCILLGVGIIILGAYLNSSLMIVVGVFVVLASIAFKKYVKRVSAGEIMVIDRGGSFLKKDAGYIFLIPILDKELKRMPKGGRRWKVSLFQGKDGMDREEWFDMKGGGKIKITDPEIWISLDDPVAALKADENFEERVRETAEYLVRLFFNSKSVEEVQDLKAGDIKKEIEEKLREEFSEEDSSEAESFVNVKFWNFTYDNWDFDPSTTEARKQLYQSEIGIEISRNKAKAEFEDLLGSYVSKVAETRGISTEEARLVIKNNEQMQKDLQKMYNDFKQRKLTNVTDIRIGSTDGTPRNGGGGLEDLLVLWKTLTGGSVSGPSSKKESGEKSSSGENKGGDKLPRPTKKEIDEQIKQTAKDIRAGK